MKADDNTITPFCVNVMRKYKVLSKREHCLIKVSNFGFYALSHDILRFRVAIKIEKRNFDHDINYGH